MIESLLLTCDAVVTEGQFFSRRPVQSIAGTRMFSNSSGAAHVAFRFRWRTESTPLSECREISRCRMSPVDSRSVRRDRSAGPWGATASRAVSPIVAGLSVRECGNAVRGQPPEDDSPRPVL